MQDKVNCLVAGNSCIRTENPGIGRVEVTHWLWLDSSQGNLLCLTSDYGYISKVMTLIMREYLNIIRSFGSGFHDFDAFKLG